MLESDAYKQLIDEIGSIRKYLEEAKKPKEVEWLTSEEVCKKLKVSSRTLQNYRDRNLVSFVQFSSKILYSTKHIDEFLNNHLVKRGGQI